MPAMSTIDRMTRGMSLAAALALLVACQAPHGPPAGPDLSRPADSARPPAPEAPTGGRIYHVTRDDSRLRVVLYPEGPLSRFGHPHVVGGAAVDGWVALTGELHASALRLEVHVADLDVDRPEWRSAEGFDPQMPGSAVADTRRNMLSGAVLDSAAHPRIVIESLGVTGPAWQPDVDVRITLRGVARDLTVPVALNVTDARLIATGRFMIRQSDFGIEPFSAAGGRLRVADRLLIRFRVVARATGDGAAGRSKGD